MQAFDVGTLTSEKVTIVEQLLNSDDFTVSKIKKENETAAIFLPWVTSLIAFFKSGKALGLKTPADEKKIFFDDLSSS